MPLFFSYVFLNCVSLLVKPSLKVIDFPNSIKTAIIFTRQVRINRSNCVRSWIKAVPFLKIVREFNIITKLPVEVVQSPHCLIINAERVELAEALVPLLITCHHLRLDLLARAPVGLQEFYLLHLLLAEVVVLLVHVGNEAFDY